MNIFISFVWYRIVSLYVLIAFLSSHAHAFSQLVVSRYQSDSKLGVSPRLGKRELIQQRRSRTMAIRDDSETVKVKQKPVRVADALKVK